MSTRHSRGVTVRVVAGFLALLLVAPGPMDAIARAGQARRVARAAIRHLGSGLDVEPMPVEQERPQRTTRASHAPVASAILPIPLRPASVAWLSPQEAPRDPWALFDGLASRALDAPTTEPVRVSVQLESSAALAAVTVLGPAQGTLSVFAQDRDSLRPIESLVNVTLNARAGEWKRLATQDVRRIEGLVIEWTALRAGGPAEVGLWGLGLPERNAIDAELADRILSDAAPGAASFHATPEEGRIARVELGPEAPVGPGRSATFHTTLTSDPRSLGRAFLVYELAGMGHFLEPIRQINGLAPRGGSVSSSVLDGSPSEGGLQVEEIAPEWLRAGDNEIRFLPLSTPGAPDYVVRRVRIVGTGHAVVRDARFSGAPDGKERREQTLAFEVPSQLHDAVFELLKPSDGALVIHTPNARGQRPARIDLHGLEVGWHRAEIGALPVSDSVALTLELPGQKTIGGAREGSVPTISEVAVTASERPDESDERRLVVAYPLHGECVEHQARVRGFVRGPAGADAVLAFRAEGRRFDEAVGADGSFEIAVPEPARSIGHSWDVAVEAELVGGRVLRRTVHVEACFDPTVREDGKRAEDEGAPFAEVVRASEAKTIAFGGARLDIPAGAVDKDVRITVRPLVADRVPKMNSGMANVSPAARAFRFGPHGLKFKKPVKITLPYDPGALAPGEHERHIFSFYYDETAGRWVRIGRFGMAEGGALTSLTEHFTDFVNATLARPDEPGPQSFNPNEMKGIKLARPSAGIDREGVEGRRQLLPTAADIG